MERDLNAMTDAEYRVLENRLRRSAARQGLSLIKSRSRDPRALGYGQYLIADAPKNGFLVHGGHGGYADLDLNEVEDYLTQDPE